MILTPEKWLEKYKKQGLENKPILILRGKQYTPKQIVQMGYLFWKQAAKSL